MLIWLRGPYCVINPYIFWDRDRADLEVTLNRKGYLLNRLLTEEVLFALVMESNQPAISCHGPLGMSWGNMGWAGREALCLVSYGAPVHVVNYICVDAGPVNCLSGLGLHFCHPLVCTMCRSVKVWSRRLGGCRLSLPSGEYQPQWTAHPGCPQTVTGNPWDVLEAGWAIPCEG